MKRHITYAMLCLCVLARAAWPHIAGDDVIIPWCGRLLSEWRVSQARQLAEHALEARGRDPRDLVALAQVRFYEARYEDALKLLAEAKTKTKFDEHVATFEQLLQGVWKTASTYKTVESDHFSIRFAPGKDSILVEPAIECLEKAYQAIGADMDYKPEDKVVVEICPNAASFVIASTLKKKEIDGSGTIGICKFNRVMITTPRVTLHGYRWQDTLCHEYVHYVLIKKSRNRVPLWLHEGCAKYEETRWRRAKGGLMPPIGCSVLAEGVDTDRLVSFKRMYPTFAQLDGYEATLAYSQVQSMVAMIVDKRGMAGLRQLIDALAVGAKMDQAMGQAIGMDMAHFLPWWRKRLKRSKLARIPGLKPMLPRLKRGPEGKDREAEDIETLRDEGSKQAADFTRLGDMLREQRRPKAAAVEYRKADAAVGTISPIVRTRLAFAQIEFHEFTAASKTLESVLAVYPDYQPAYAIMGQLYVAQQDFANAVKPLREAIVINPFDYVARATLAKAYERTGCDELARKENEAIVTILRKEGSSPHER